jgi:tetratricopeptide (TPR) repeat protein
MIFKIQVKAGSGKLIKKALILIVFVLATGRLLSQDNQLEQWYQQALLLKQQQNCREAIPLLEKILQVNPAFKETVYELGWCFNEMKQYSKALEVFQLKPSITAQYFKLVYERAYSKAALGFTTDAINDYDQVSQWQPAFAPVYAAKADLYKDRIKDVSKALPLYLKAITLDTGSARNYYWAGWCYNELEQFEKAVPHLVKASENPAFRSLAFSEIGFSYYSLANYNLALDFLTKSNNLRPNLELNLFYMGMCYVKMGGKTLALKKYNELVLMGSDYAISLLNEIKNMK